MCKTAVSLYDCGFAIGWNSAVCGDLFKEHGNFMKTAFLRACVGLCCSVLLAPAFPQSSTPAQGGTAAGSASPPASTTPSAAGAQAPGAGQRAGNAPPVSVTTVRVQKRDVPVTLKGSGTVVALTSVDVRPQMSNAVSKVHFAEGQFVKKGQLLFTLDARVEEANLVKAKAQLAKDQASHADAQRQLARAQDLFAQNFISKGAVETAQAQVESWAATINADQAAVAAAEVSLSFSRISAPVAGRVGAVNVTAGGLVQANVTPLVTITQLDPIGVAFSIPQRNLQDALGALKGGGAPIVATLADGGGSFKGKLTFVDNAVDMASGTVKAKASFANKDSKLWPGAFVQIAQTVTVLKDALVIPQVTIVQGARGTTVFVVGEGKATVRPVKVVFSDGTDAVVTGLKPGEVVVMDGRQNVRPNSPVLERPREPRAEGGDGARGGKPERADGDKSAKPEQRSSEPDSAAAGEVRQASGEAGAQGTKGGKGQKPENAQGAGSGKPAQGEGKRRDKGAS